MPLYLWLSIRDSIVITVLIEMILKTNEISVWVGPVQITVMGLKQ